MIVFGAPGVIPVDILAVGAHPDDLEICMGGTLARLAAAGRQIGLVDLADMIYVRSEFYRQKQQKDEKPILFGEKEGRIALANRRKDPLYLFAALQRHLGYPGVPRPQVEETQRYLLPALQRHVERLETRLKLLEEELRGGINIARFYAGKEEKKEQ